MTATAPVFTSGTSTTFTALSAGTFSVTANGDTPISFTETGTLPSGVTLASNGTLSGTPASGTVGSYPITIKATDANANTSTQAFTLKVINTPPTTSVLVPANGAAVHGTSPSWMRQPPPLPASGLAVSSSSSPVGRTTSR